MIITITNNKGGTSKTTTAQCLAVGLSIHNKKVLLIDSDPQSNLTYVFNLLKAPKNLYNLYTNTCNIEECIYTASFKYEDKEHKLDLIPSSHLLSNADNEFLKEPYLSLGCQTLLKTKLDKIKNNYDYIIIDTPPTLAILTLNALMSSNTAIVPMQTDVFSLQGLSNLKQKIDLINQNPIRTDKLYIDGILLTKYNDRAILNRDLRQSILNASSQFNTKIFNTYIRESVAVRESQASNTCVLLQSPNNNVSIDYMNFVKEFLKERER